MVSKRVLKSFKGAVKMGAIADTVLEILERLVELELRVKSLESQIQNKGNAKGGNER